MYTKVTFSSPRTGAEYEFLLEKDLPSTTGYRALCTTPRGVLQAEGDTLKELLFLVLPDSVAAWEGVMVT